MSVISTFCAQNRINREAVCACVRALLGPEKKGKSIKYFLMIQHFASQLFWHMMLSNMLLIFLLLLLIGYNVHR